LITIHYFFGRVIIRETKMKDVKTLTFCLERIVMVRKIKDGEEMGEESRFSLLWERIGKLSE